MDPTGDYYYNFTDKVAPVSWYEPTAGSKPQDYAMQEFEDYWPVAFPFPVNNCTFAKGNLCNLDAGGWITPCWLPLILPIGILAHVCGALRIVNVHPNSFQLKVVSNGYFDAPGSWVEFRTEVNDGWIEFNHVGHAPHTTGIAGKVAVYLAEHIVWPMMDQNLQYILDAATAPAQIPPVCFNLDEFAWYPLVPSPVVCGAATSGVTV